MSETWKVETWREEEQEDSCSSCSSYLPLESSNDTEIITVPAEHVPGVPSDIERTFLMERLLESYRQAMDSIRRAQEDGGAPGSVPQDTDTDTVPQDTDTDTVPQDTDTDQAQDTDTTQTQDIHDTQAIY